MPLPSLGHSGCVFTELSKTTLLEMMTTMVARSQVLELEEKVQVLTDQRNSLDQELSATSTELEKEKVRVESMSRHEEVQPAPERGERLSCCRVPGLWGMGATAPHGLTPHHSPCRLSRGPCCSSWTAWTRSVRSCRPAWERPRRTRPGWQSNWSRARSRVGNSSRHSR